MKTFHVLKYVESSSELHERTLGSNLILCEKIKSTHKFNNIGLQMYKCIFCLHLFSYSSQKSKSCVFLRLERGENGEYLLTSKAGEGVGGMMTMIWKQMVVLVAQLCEYYRNRSLMCYRNRETAELYTLENKS